MNKQFKTTGIIIRKFDLNDADRIVTVLTKEHGKINCIAKGARRLKSRFCGRLELLYEVSFDCFQGRSLASINEAHVLSAFSEEKDLEKYRTLFYLSEITNKLIQEGQLIEGVYPLVCETLTELKNDSSTEIVLHAFLIKMLTLTGFLSPWNRCATCDDSLNPKKPIWLSLTDASTICTDCKTSGDRILTIGLVKWINYMQHYPLSEVVKVKVEKRDHQSVWEWLQGVLANTLSTPVKSEGFL